MAGLHERGGVLDGVGSSEHTRTGNRRGAPQREAALDGSSSGGGGGSSGHARRRRPPSDQGQQQDGGKQSTAAAAMAAAGARPRRGLQAAAAAAAAGAETAGAEGSGGGNSGGGGGGGGDSGGSSGGGGSSVQRAAREHRHHNSVPGGGPALEDRLSTHRSGSYATTAAGDLFAGGADGSSGGGGDVEAQLREQFGQVGQIAAQQGGDGGYTRPARLSGDLVDHLIVVPEHKLLFCFIAKCNSLAFNDLFRSLRERFDPSMADDSVKFGRNTYAYHNLSLEELTDRVYDPSWHKAVFYREPLVRFVSAYRSKCDRDSQEDGVLCKRVFGLGKHPRFSAVTQRLSDAAAHPIDANPHWRPQADFCGGLAETLAEYQTVEALDARDSREKVAKLLSDVGVADPESIPVFNLHFPPPDAGPDAGPHNHHATHADDKVQRYYTPRRACTVVRYYLDDYLLFGVPVPAWTRRWNFHEQRWARGSDACAALPDEP